MQRDEHVGLSGCRSVIVWLDLESGEEFVPRAVADAFAEALRELVEADDESRLPRPNRRTLVERNQRLYWARGAAHKALAGYPKAVMVGNNQPPMAPKAEEEISAREAEMLKATEPQWRGGGLMGRRGSKAEGE
jgi:hypothetical protein